MSEGGKIVGLGSNIDFECEFGMWPFRKQLKISRHGFEWCGELFPLKSIESVRWGVLQKRGGVFPKYLYVVAFGADGREFTVKTKQKDFYEHLSVRVWRAAGRRLLSRLADTLLRRETVKYGDVAVSDKGAKFFAKELFGSGKGRFFLWEELFWTSAGGSLCFVKRDEPDKLLAGLSFLNVDNVRVLDAALTLLARSDSGTSLGSAIDSAL